MPSITATRRTEKNLPGRWNTSPNTAYYTVEGVIDDRPSALKLSAISYTRTLYQMGVLFPKLQFAIHLRRGMARGGGHDLQNASVTNPSPAATNYAYDTRSLYVVPC